jgi:hypothetical protein
MAFITVLMIWDASVAFVIPLVALLMSVPFMWHEEQL